LVAALAVAAGCASRRPMPVPADVFGPSAAAATDPGHYVLQVGDRVAVRFYRTPELDTEVVVRPDGKVSLQYVEDIQAAGLTPEGLAREVERRYAKELVDPQVSVIVGDPGGLRYYVGGEVARQGVQRLAGGVTLFQAIQEAGGFAKTANRKQVVLVRRGPNGETTARTIDMRPVQRGERLEDDVVLQPYDVVFVPRSKVADVNAFVELYVRNNLPVNPGIGVPF
jgi:protein involved in polysaccharide export with SLBB domain